MIVIARLIQAFNAESEETLTWDLLKVRNNDKLHSVMDIEDRSLETDEDEKGYICICNNEYTDISHFICSSVY